MLKGLEAESILTLTWRFMLRNKWWFGCFLLSRFGTFGRWISGDGYGNLSSLVKVGSASSKIALPYCHSCQSNLRPLNLRPSYS